MVLWELHRGSEQSQRQYELRKVHYHCAKPNDAGNPEPFLSSLKEFLHQKHQAKKHTFV